jgi:hypothetical protein
VGGTRGGRADGVPPFDEFTASESFDRLPARLRLRHSVARACAAASTARLRLGFREHLLDPRRSDRRRVFPAAAERRFFDHGFRDRPRGSSSSSSDQSSAAMVSVCDRRIDFEHDGFEAARPRLLGIGG